MAEAFGCGVGACSALVSNVFERGMADGIALEGRLPGVLLERVPGIGGTSACSHSACPAVQAGLFWAHLRLGGSWGFNECADVVILDMRMEV